MSQNKFVLYFASDFDFIKGILFKNNLSGENQADKSKRKKWT